MSKVYFFLILVILSSCGISGGPSYLSGSRVSFNLFDKGPIHSGFLVGTSSNADAVGVQLDSGAIQAVTGTASWRFALPTTWALGSRHTITVGARNGDQFVVGSTTTVTVFKRNNQDFNGDGYADLALGAQGYNNGLANDGAVYIYLSSPSGIAGGQTAGTPTIKGPPNGANYFGSNLVSEDINGDGYADLAVGSFAYNNGVANDGAVWIYYGSEIGITEQTAGAPTLKGKASQASSFGSTMTIADLNADGFADLIVSAYALNSSDGAIYVFNGSSSGIASQTAGTPTVKGHVGGAENLGSSLAVGDINGDGYADLAIGAWAYDNGTQNDGAIYVYSGSTNGITNGQTVTIPTIKGPAALASGLGWDICIGDVNGDGYADIVSGTPYYNNGAVNDGALFIFYGANAGLTSNQTAGDPAIKGHASLAEQFGFVVTAEDLNRDGYADIIAHSFAYDNGLSNDGALYVFNGGADKLSSLTTETPTVKGHASGSEILGWMATARDMNQDGYLDLIVPGYGYNAQDGAVYIYESGPNGIAAGKTADIPTIKGHPGSAENFAVSVNRSN